MKTLKKIFIPIIFTALTFTTLNAQTFNYPVKSAKRLVIKNLVSDIKFEQ